MIGIKISHYMAKTKIPPFKNEEYKDYSQLSEYRKMKAALEKTGDALGKKYPLVIGGKKILTDEAISSYNPAKRTEVIGKFGHGTTKHAEDALQTASKAFESWSKVPFENRAKALFT